MKGETPIFAAADEYSKKSDDEIKKERELKLAASEQVSLTVDDPGKAVDLPLNINVRLRVTVETV